MKTLRCLVPARSYQCILATGHHLCTIYVASENDFTERRYTNALLLQPGICTCMSVRLSFRNRGVCRLNATSVVRRIFLWPPCVALADADIIFCPVVSSSSSSFFFLSSIHRLFSAVPHLMSTILPHIV